LKLGGKSRAVMFKSVSFGPPEQQGANGA